VLGWGLECPVFGGFFGQTLLPAKYTSQKWHTHWRSDRLFGRYSLSVACY